MQLIPFNKRQDPKPVTLRSAMNQLFDESFWDPFPMLNNSSTFLRPTEGSSAMAQFIPNVDVSETEKKIKIIADLPGYDPKDIDIHLEDATITIQGSMNEEKEEKDDKEKWYKKECSSGSFYRQFSLPDTIEENDVTCAFKHGKLTITLPKKKKEDREKKGKKLEIELT